WRGPGGARRPSFRVTATSTSGSCGRSVATSESSRRPARG
ncbi:MAG: hypothetical protein AVDCRST_MAG53-3346, partial [uncultured Solirubrobacteraceae bacterium]